MPPHVISLLISRIIASIIICITNFQIHISLVIETCRQVGHATNTEPELPQAGIGASRKFAVMHTR